MPSGYHGVRSHSAPSEYVRMSAEGRGRYLREPATPTSSTLRLPAPIVNASVDIYYKVASLRGCLTRTPARIVSAMP